MPRKKRKVKQQDAPAVQHVTFDVPTDMRESCIRDLIALHNAEYVLLAALTELVVSRNVLIPHERQSLGVGLDRVNQLMAKIDRYYVEPNRREGN